MNLVSVDNISKTMGDKELFREISFGIDEGQKIAIIGINGCGKSTLLKIIAGIETSDMGNIAYNNNLKYTYLEQIPTYKSGDTILDHLFNDDSDEIKLLKKYEDLCDKLSKNYNDKIQEELDQVIKEMDSQNGWLFEQEVKSILSELGINDLAMKMDILSGGMLKKVALAQALIKRANLLILDEPTNHLDIKTIEWLQKYLENTNKSLFLVTHDRYFLDNVCNSIYEIDEKKLYKFSGNYSYYLEKKAEIEYVSNKKEERAQDLLKRELAWLKTGAKARTTKQKARIDRANELMNREKLQKKGNIDISFTGRKLGKKILEIKNITKSYGANKVLNPFNYTFKHNEKIGIIGPNGSGKTTLLDIITEQIKPTSGHIVKGINTYIGYFDQHNHHLNPEQKVIDFIKESAEIVISKSGRAVAASELLDRFLFPSNTHYKTISRLSGGEKRRLYLLHILIQNPNFLIFDEPTNDLDIKTLAVLEEFLQEFTGCLLVVSHDRYFVDRVADYLLVLDGEGNINGFAGNYTDYIDYETELEREKQEEAAAQQKEKIKEKPKREKKGLSFQEKKEFENLELEIEELEEEKSKIEDFFTMGSDNHEEFLEYSRKYEELKKLLSEKMDRWEYLAEKDMK